MSENTDSEAVVTASQKATCTVENSQEERTQSECLPTVNATSDELFDSFMEIANDPKLHDIDNKNNTLGGGETLGSTDDSENVGTSDQYESTESPMDFLVKESNNSQNGQPDHDNVPLNDAVDNNSKPEESSSSRNGELSDVKSPKYFSLDGEPVQDATDLPTAEVTSLSDRNDCKLEEVLPTSSGSVSVSESAKLKDPTCETENPVKSPENQENASSDVHETVAEIKEQSVVNIPELDSEESLLEKSGDGANDKEQDSQKEEVAHRLSKAVEDLAGLEQLLSSVVSEFKVANSERTVEKIDEGKEGNSLDQKEEKSMSDYSGNLSLEKNEKDVHGIVSQGSEGEDESNKGTEKVVCDCSEVKGQSGTLEFKGDQMNKIADSAESDKQVPDDKDTQVEEDVSLVSDSTVEINKEESIMDKLIDKKTEPSVESESVGKPDAEISAEESAEKTLTDRNGITADANLEKSETVNKSDPNICKGESAENKVTDESGIVAEASLEKSDGKDKEDSNVTNADMSVPGIEITVTDESETSENKSLDSMDTEEDGPSNGNPSMPSTASDEGIDSDTASDYGDDDDVVADPENLGSAANVCKRKSWCLEINRERLSSDSSTVSEKDFKETYSKGDSADGKSVKEDYIRGHLLKMGGTGLTPKNWRKRWFVLRGDNCLYYYKSSKDKVPCGVIILTNYSVSKAPEINKNHSFKLTKGGARTYYMCAGSESDMKKWIMAMMDAAKVSSADSNPFNIFEGNVHNVSIPALSIRDPDCHGYLYKQGSNYKIWRRRYFVLKNGFLYYYTDMSNTVALGVVKLLDYTIATGDHSGRKFYFSASSPDKSVRTYYFAAESEMDRKRWLSKLEDSIKKGSSAH